MKNEWLTVGEMRLHVPSVVVGGLRLAASAFGTGQPYRDELMQAWFDGFGALLWSECDLSQQEASEYLRSLLVTLLPHLSAGAQESIMQSLSKGDQNGCPGDCNTESGNTVEVAIYLFGSPEVELDDYERTGQGIREFAAANSGWLGSVADAVDKLIGDGWAVQVVESNIVARHSEVHTCQDAVTRLSGLRIDETIMIDIDISEVSADG